ncbi:MAG: pyridoxal phosphate-dependent aminotransferase [Candidatus Bathyarchaeota archaeon]|nr:pyridoxal phosphate-dependent aminotransferase [Candidatus Bathyarchaeota archaeon]
MVSGIKPANRLKNLKYSGIRRFFDIAKKNPNVINLSVGEPDFVPPKHALDAGWEAMEKGETHYTSTNGIRELREALAQKAYHEYGLNYDPDTEILITAGGTEAIFLAASGLVNPGDEVLIPNPGFVCYEPSVLLAGGVPVHVPLREENSFKPSSDDVISRITKKSRVMILNYPNNPTGAVLSHEEAASLAKIAVEHDMIVISDEVYEKIVYDDAKHSCFASFPGMRERTLVVNSFSKTYAMTGLRVGYVYGPKELISFLWLVHQYTVACVDTLAQHIALAALKGPQDFVKHMVHQFDKRRQLVHKRLMEIGGFNCSLPKGAFYVFPNIKDFGMSSEEFAEFLVREANVVTVPGSAFGVHGEGYIRISYAAAYEKLEEALNRIEMAVKKIR